MSITISDDQIADRLLEMCKLELRQDCTNDVGAAALLGAAMEIKASFHNSNYQYEVVRAEAAEKVYEHLRTPHTRLHVGEHPKTNMIIADAFIRVWARGEPGPNRFTTMLANFESSHVRERKRLTEMFRPFGETFPGRLAEIIRAAPQRPGESHVFATEAARILGTKPENLREALQPVATLSS